MDEINKKYFGGNRVKKLFPGVIRNDERKDFDKLKEPESELKNEELWFRANNK